MFESWIMFGCSSPRTIQSPFFKQVTAPALSRLESCLSLEICLGVPPQESFPHPTFLLAWVLQPREGHRVTVGTPVPSSKEFSFTHTKPFSNFNTHTKPFSNELVLVRLRPVCKENIAEAGSCPWLSSSSQKASPPRTCKR